MKKFIPFLIIPLLIGLLILLIIDNKEKVISKIMTVSTNYHYLYEDNQTIDVGFYTNNLELPINELALYDNFKLKSENSNTIVNLDLKEVNYSHDEVYLQEVYRNYIFKFVMPNLENDLKIEDAYLNFKLADEGEFELFLGSFKLIVKDDYKALNWHLAEGSKSDTNNHSISSLKIGIPSSLATNDFTIDIGLDSNVEYEINEQLLIINIPKLAYFTNNLFVLISTDSYTYYLSNTFYTKEYSLLSKASGIINIYEFS